MIIKQSIPILTLTVLSFLYNANSSNITGHWEKLPTPNFFGNGIGNLKVIEGLPYVAFSDNNHKNKVSVYSFRDSAWEPVGNPGFSDSAAYQFQLTNDNNRLYIAYFDNFELIVKRLAGAIWEKIGVFPMASQTLPFNICVKNGMVYISYRTWDWYPSNGVIEKFNGLSWEVINPKPTGLPMGKYSGGFRIDLDQASLFATLYSEVYPEVTETQILKFKGSAWDTILNAKSGDSISLEQNIVVNNTLYAPCLDSLQTGRGCFVAYYEGNSWKNLGNSVAANSSRILNLIYSEALYAAYLDTMGHVSIRKYDGSKWSDVGPSVDTAYCKISFDRYFSSPTTSLASDGHNLYLVCTEEAETTKVSLLKFTLDQAYPTEIVGIKPYPASVKTIKVSSIEKGRVSFFLPEAGSYSISAYNIAGGEVMPPVRGYGAVGDNSVFLRGNFGEAPASIIQVQYGKQVTRQKVRVPQFD